MMVQQRVSDPIGAHKVPIIMAPLRSMTSATNDIDPGTACPARCNTRGRCERRGAGEQMRASGIGVVTTHTPTTKRPS